MGLAKPEGSRAGDEVVNRRAATAARPRRPADEAKARADRGAARRRAAARVSDVAMGSGECVRQCRGLRVTPLIGRGEVVSGGGRKNNGRETLQDVEGRGEPYVIGGASAGGAGGS